MALPESGGYSPPQPPGSSGGSRLGPGGTGPQIFFPRTTTAWLIRSCTGVAVGQWLHEHACTVTAFSLSSRLYYWSVAFLYAESRNILLTTCRWINWPLHFFFSPIFSWLYNSVLSIFHYLNIHVVAFTQNVYGTEWPFMCWCVVKKLLAKSFPEIRFL